VVLVDLAGRSHAMRETVADEIILRVQIPC
jgi:hypothetical protein